MSLFDAVSAGELPRVRALLAEGVDPNLLGERGRTPLMVAAEAGHVGVVQALLAAGAEPFLTDELGETALLISAAHGHGEVCELLLPHASDDERDLARRLLRDCSLPGVLPPGPADEGERPSDSRRKLASVGAYVANKLGDDGPAKRLARLFRSEKGRK
ncbi:Ankyrin repeat protein [Stigmatella aurantiaca DW4/3-1]|uniref:Ankyrin repeat domain 15 n=2 Tax=Stigmatella aurantiaca TaxID=41 RepID=Q08PQ0_STIAD|nr:ankyrin repeat domain-containing protein [Stigmatella aurantiaca]ADO76028.1 Ankyrin repeat protein [Stigmatella aurantiaca DW4/3-1]EAU62460.1 ankyrin repeat domain 15 [Stigmatella aurantiaca DW4/3-1]